MPATIWPFYGGRQGSYCTFKWGDLRRQHQICLPRQALFMNITANSLEQQWLACFAKYSRLTANQPVVVPLPVRIARSVAEFADTVLGYRRVGITPSTFRLM